MRGGLNTCKHLNKHHVSKANFHSSLPLPFLSFPLLSPFFLHPPSASRPPFFSPLSLSPSSFYLPPPNSLPPFFLLLSSYPPPSPLLTPPPSCPSSLPHAYLSCLTNWTWCPLWQVLMQFTQMASLSELSHVRQLHTTNTENGKQKIVQH